jgi:hypothetical protein
MELARELTHWRVLAVERHLKAERATKKTLGLCMRIEQSEKAAGKLRKLIERMAAYVDEVRLLQAKVIESRGGSPRHLNFVLERMHEILGGAE